MAFFPGVNTTILGSLSATTNASPRVIVSCILLFSDRNIGGCSTVVLLNAIPIPLIKFFLVMLWKYAVEPNGVAATMPSPISSSFIFFPLIVSVNLMACVGRAFLTTISLVPSIVVVFMRASSFICCTIVYFFFLISSRAWSIGRLWHFLQVLLYLNSAFGTPGYFRSAHRNVPSPP